MKADLTQTRELEKQMWNVVNEKRDVSIPPHSAFDSSLVVELETTAKGE